MDRLTAAHIAPEPAVRSMPDVSIDFLQRTAKFVGDALWFSFLSLIFTSISVGLTARWFF